MQRLVNPAALKEKVFSANFIQQQLQIIKNASQAVTQSGLLEEKKINAVINYMNALYANAQDYSINGNAGNTIEGLLNLINNTIKRLTEQYKWSGVHPLVPALTMLLSNVKKYVQFAQPQFYKQCLQEYRQETAEGEGQEIVDTPIKSGPETERVFSNNFIQLQGDLIEAASRTVTDEGLLEEKSMRTLIDYMQDLHITSELKVSGVKVSARSYTGLLELIDELVDDLKSHYQWKKTHPLIPALNTIKNNMQQYIIATQPQFAHHLKLEQTQNLTTIAASRWEMTKDACCVFLCALWCLPEKILTLDNGLQSCCGPSNAICPGPALPKLKQNGKMMYWSIWAPGESMAALCKDMGDHAVNIDALKDEPIQHSMN